MNNLKTWTWCAYTKSGLEKWNFSLMTISTTLCITQLGGRTLSILSEDSNIWPGATNKVAS